MFIFPNQGQSTLKCHSRRRLKVLYTISDFWGIGNWVI